MTKCVVVFFFSLSLWGAENGLQADNKNSGPPLKLLLTPSGGDDYEALQAALDAMAARGPKDEVTLAAGTFRGSRPLVVTNLAATIRGAGLDATIILADGTVGEHPDGLFLNPSQTEVDNTELPPFPILFAFAESDTDRLGNPAERRSLDLTISDLTLGAPGTTELHFDINTGKD